MNWNKDKSIALSRICTAVFAVLLLALDIGCYWIVKWFSDIRPVPWQYSALRMAAVYLCSVFAWLLLVHLWKLLGNISREEVFTEGNVRHLRAVSWCCLGAACICLVCSPVCLPFLFIAGAAGFMALIVRIVKNVFQQAIAMKSELDLTI
ncbi:MAG: DUF2975 domain-containing protein [Clostridia bacterium]|nr:DUF2975 domain-containing protein [Clostridia bacterium]